MNKTKNKKHSTFKIIISFPSFWIAIIILCLAIIAILLSVYSYNDNNTFIYSLCLNMFAGLVTGLIITLLSSIKLITIHKLDVEIYFLNEIHNMIMKYFDSKRKVMESLSCDKDKFFNIAYDAGASMNHVNEKIIQSTFNKNLHFDSMDYFKKNYNYDALEVAKKLSELRDYIINYSISTSSNKDVFHQIEKESDIIFNLNISILDSIKLLELKKNILSKSII